MATITKEAIIKAPPEAVWAAVRDVGRIHLNLCPGFVTDTRMDGEDRIVTFGNGLVLRERIISLDDERRRLAWNAVSERLSHHNGVMQVFDDELEDCTRIVWTADLLPHEIAPTVEAMMDAGVAAMKATLERRARIAKGA
jgi:uncharacterized protein YndB with AHSA1/START domain